MWNNRLRRSCCFRPRNGRPRCSIPPSTPSSRPYCRRRRLLTTSRGDETLRVRRSHDVSRAAGRGRDSRERGAGGRDPAPAATRRACRSSPAAPGPASPAVRCPTSAAIVLSMAKFRRIVSHRSAGAHRRRPARRAQSGDLRGGSPVRPLLRARPVVADRLHHRRQRRRERRRRALPQVRPHRPQRPARARRAHHRRDRRIRRRRARQRRATTCWRWSTGPRACSRSSPRSRSSSRRSRRRRRWRSRRSTTSAQAGAAVAAVIARRHRAGGARDDGPARRRAPSRSSSTPSYPLDAAAVLLVETDGTPEEVAADMAEITRVLGEAGATGIRVSKDERERLLLWSGRKAAFPAIGRITPDYYCMDGTIPRRALAARAAAHRGALRTVPAALRQRVPRRRRQPAPADHVRRQRRATRSCAPRPSAPPSSSCASRSAARSPASTVWASRSCRRCACSSGRPSSSASSASRRRSMRIRCSTRARASRRSPAARSSARCTCTTAGSPHPDLPRF